MFSKHQNKAEFRNLDDSAVISIDFSGLRTFAASKTSTASTTSIVSMTLAASFYQKIIDSDVWIIPSIQMIKTRPFLWNGSSEINFLSDICYPFCQRLLRSANVNFLKLIDEPQISIPPEATRHHNLSKLMILLPLRASYF